MIDQVEIDIGKVGKSYSGESGHSYRVDSGSCKFGFNHDTVEKRSDVILHFLVRLGYDICTVSKGMRK